MYAANLSLRTTISCLSLMRVFRNSWFSAAATFRSIGVSPSGPTHIRALVLKQQVKQKRGHHSHSCCGDSGGRPTTLLFSTTCRNKGSTASGRAYPLTMPALRVAETGLRPTDSTRMVRDLAAREYPAEAKRASLLIGEGLETLT